MHKVFSQQEIAEQKAAIVSFLEDYGAANIATIGERSGFYSKHDPEAPEPFVRVALLELISENKIEMDIIYSASKILEDIEYSIA